MCETNAYVAKEDKEELYLENIDIIRPEAGGVYLRSLFGEQKSFPGSIKEISLARHKIILKEE
ncbi:MAG: CooT family nickel-binding protein [Nitrospirae bacterium]|nr:CooT family nickel-binding protein [Nitrospirota bacterium]